MNPLKAGEKSCGDLVLACFLERAGKPVEARVVSERASKGWSGALPAILGRDALERLPKPR